MGEKRFKMITAEQKNEMVEVLKKAIDEQFRKELVQTSYYKYEVEVQSNKFITYMSEEELTKSAEKTVDLMEEMKEISNNGMTRERLEKIAADAEKKYEGDAMHHLAIFNELRTDKMSELICELDNIRRVGGAYAMLMANPVLKSAIYAVYDVMVDRFDDEEFYEQSAFFLLRVIMKMHSEEVD